MNLSKSKTLNLLYLAECVSLHSTKGDFAHVKEVIEAFVRRHANVIVLIRGKETPDFFKNHLFTFRLPDLPFPLSAFTYFISTLVIALELSVNKPDVIYVRDNGLNIGVIIGKIFHVPVLLEINGDLQLEYSFRKALMAKLLLFMLKNSYSLADAIVIPSRGQLPILVSYQVCKDKIHVVPNGVDSNKFSPQNKLLARQDLGLDRNSIYFCFVGNLAPWQGVDNAITAFSVLAEKVEYRSVKLLIVGDGSKRKELEKLASQLNVADRITFLGAVKHEEIPRIVNACDVCLAPFTVWRNRKIGVSALKLYEYLSCGKPVIASSIPGTEIIEELDAGILVEPDNVEDLKTAFEEATSLLPYWENRASLLHETMALYHSWDSRVDDITEILHYVNQKKSPQ
jgi:glycosyltransferase involved in cell wall biosynthesis